MMKHHFFQHSIQVVFSTCLIFTSIQAVNAKPDAQPIAAVTRANTVFALQANSGIPRGDIQTSITGPRGYSVNVKGSTNIDLAEFGELDDGLYRYEIKAATGKKIKLRKDRPDNGRGNKERDFVTESETQTGVFRVKSGSIVTDSKTIKE